MSKVILNNTPLSHFARAGRLDTLKVLTHSHERYAHVEVRNELKAGYGNYPELKDVEGASWLSWVNPISEPYVRLFAVYSSIVGSRSGRDIGEAATLAWAEWQGAVAVIDDQAGTAAGKKRGVQVVGSLNLIARGLVRQSLSEDEVKSLVDELIATGFYAPFQSGKDFLAWARLKGLV